MENFKRSKEEVDGLLKLAKEKFEKLLEESGKLMEKGICVRIFGDFTKLSLELQKLFAKVE